LLGTNEREGQLSFVLGDDLGRYVVEVFGEDELNGREAREVVEQCPPAGALESLGRVAPGVLENLQAVLVGLMGCLPPEVPDEPGGRGAQDRRVLADEPLGPGQIALGRKALPKNADTARYARSSMLSVG
jgi:hypothetical protein